MQQCPYCDRWFKNVQALSAHKRFCKEKFNNGNFPNGNSKKEISKTEKPKRKIPIRRKYPSKKRRRITPCNNNDHVQKS